MAQPQLEKVYDPNRVEDKWYQHWLDQNYFHVEPNPQKKPYTVVIPPPNITGMLTMGHVLNNTIQDILIRKARMQGKQACWIPGTDHASIATETKVVDMLMEQGIKKDSLSREEFIDHAWKWKEKYGGLIIQQLKKLGCSCDWERERFTMDDGYTRAVLEAFVKLYEKGLIYKGHRLVNWCPVSKSAISDEEVTHKEVTGHLWYFRYPITNSGEFLVVATTRPETMLGDTAVAIHPNDKRYKHLVGESVLLPLANREIPIIADEFVDPEFGTGCVKVTPSHDPNDFAIGERHNLAFINIMNADATLNSNVPEKYRDMNRENARKAVIKDIEAAGLLEKTEDYVHKVGFSERGNVPIEYYMSDQWFLKMTELSKPALDAVNKGLINFHPKHWVKTYNHWMENIKDWCISRQLWLGHRIPVWYHNENPKKIHVSLNGPKDKKNWTQDEDVLDTWASSWLWPFAVHKWPEKDRDLDYFYPTASLVTGPDIIFFWVARMIISGYEFMDSAPFKDVYFTSILRDKNGKKFSKSLGNSPDPFDLFEKYGTDAVRFGTMLMAPQGLDVLFSSKRLEVGRNFINKLWNASRFVMMNVDDQLPELDFSVKDLNLPELWILNRLQRTIERVDKNLSHFQFNEAAKAIYEFTWSDYCDWYIEIAKTHFSNGDQTSADTARAVTVHVLRNIILLLHPYAPFVTEEIWSQIKKGNDVDAIISSWPIVDERWVDETAESKMELLKGVISSVRTIRAQMNVPPNKYADMIVHCKPKQKSILNSYSKIICSLAKIDKITASEGGNKPLNSATSVVDGMEIFIPLEGLIDFDLERKRAQKRIDEIQSHLEVLNQKLNNKEFLNRAPEDVVKREKEKSEEMSEELKKMLSNLAMIQ